MSLFIRSKTYWTSLTQGSSLLLLLLIPKCSLCLFAVVNTIAVCGLKPVITPLWEYLLIGAFAIIQLSITLHEMRAKVNIVSLIISALGVMALALFLFWEQPIGFYYAGVMLITAGWIVTRIQKIRFCKEECNQSTNTLQYEHTINKNTKPYE